MSLLSADMTGEGGRMITGRARELSASALLLERHRRGPDAEL